MCRQQASTTRVRPHHAAQPGDRVAPHPQLPVVHLALSAGCDVVGAQHPHLIAAGLLGQIRLIQRRRPGHRRLQTVLVAQPLVDRRRGHPLLQLPVDVVAVRLDRRPRHLPQPGVDQLLRTTPAPAEPTRCWAPPAHPGRTRPPGPAPGTCAPSCGPPPARWPTRSSAAPHTSEPRSQSRRSR